MMSDKVASETGGLTALVIEDRQNGVLFLKPVVTHIEGELPFLRRAGMGGARYLRHCLETAFIDRFGIWPARTIQKSGEILRRIDGAKAWIVEPEIHSYKAISDTEVKLIGKTLWVAAESMAFFDGELSASSTDYISMLSDAVNDAQADLQSEAFSFLWVEMSETGLSNYRAGKGDAGTLFTSLLARQAWLERQFLVAVAADDDAAWALFHELASARYVRALCQLHRCEVTAWKEEALWPEITELGRTILLLSSCGWLKEASELAHRARHMISSHQNQFVPLIPWFGNAWGAQSSEVLALGAVSKFDPQTYDDVQWVLQHWRGDDLDELTIRLGRIADQRRWGMGQFDDEYHTDFDDGLSWTVPYEIGAVLGARAVLGLPLPKIDHPIFDLPTAHFKTCSSPLTQYQDIYARFIREV